MDSTPARETWVCQKSESPASHPSVTCLFQCGAIESPASCRKIRVLREAVLAGGDWPLLYDKLAISNTYSHAKNRNDLRPITLSKVSLPEVGFSAVTILGGGWLQSPCLRWPTVFTPVTIRKGCFCLKLRYFTNRLRWCLVKRSTYFLKRNKMF